MTITPSTPLPVILPPDIEKSPSLLYTTIDDRKYSNAPLPPPLPLPPLSTLSRPDDLTKSRKIAISTFLILCNSLLFMSFGACIGGAFAIGHTFNLDSPTTTTWIPASYPLTQGAFVLISGRIGSIHGHKLILTLGGAWWILWSLINGFCTGGIIEFSIARAMSGVGAAFVMPNVVAVIGITFPPGRGRNLSLGFFGFGAPVGGTLGCLVVGMLVEWAEWRWFFFMCAILGVIFFGALWFILPPEKVMDQDGQVDWIGAFLGLSALILFNFVWNQAPTATFSSPYIITLLPLSLLLFLAFTLHENHTPSPILPLNIFTAPSFLPLILVVLFSIMAYGIALWYMTAIQQLLRHWSALHFAIGLLPHAIFGSVAAPVAAWLVPRVAAQWILAFGACVVGVSNILLAAMPLQQEAGYWVQVFPATVLMALSSDFMFTAAQIVTTNSVKRKDQGIAGSSISLVQLYGASIGLGFAGVVERYVGMGKGMGVEGLLEGYRAALWFGVGLAGLAMVINLVFVRVPKDEREGWQCEEDLL